MTSAAEAQEFLADQDPKKRSVLIDRLLEREEFADYWAMKWCDLLRVKSEFPIKLWPNAVQAYHRWIRSCVRDNVPYDRFAREMLVASGSNFRVAPVNFYRAIQGTDPETVANAIALTFMGDGATNIGTFHESLNMAAVWGAPVVFIVTNNLYGEYSPVLMTTPISETEASVRQPWNLISGSLNSWPILGPTDSSPVILALPILF